MLMIDPPVNVFSSVDAVRDWIVELTDLRERYRDDPEALRRINPASGGAAAVFGRLGTIRTKTRVDIVHLVSDLSVR